MGTFYIRKEYFMNTNSIVQYFVACTFFVSAFGMKELPSISDISYRLATPTDIDSTLKLMNECAINDRNKIVIVPKKFRRVYLEGAIKSEYLFAAYNKDIVVAYKKAYIVPNDQKDDLLRGEIRCRAGKRTRAGTYNGLTKEYTSLVHASSTDYPDTDIYIYTGADFTHPDYRGKGINTQLTHTAFDYLKGTTKKLLEASSDSCKRLVLAYGLTAFNAGEKGGEDRTPHIITSFTPFLESLGLDASHIYHERFEAFMPTFDPSSDACIPLPDIKSVPGYGCILSVPLKKRGK